MKKILTIILVAFSLIVVNAQTVTIEEAKVVAENFMAKHGCSYSIESSTPIQVASNDVGYVFNVDPIGFLIVSAHKNTRPIIAYSFKNSLFTGNNSSPILSVVKQDLLYRQQYANLNSRSQFLKIATEWNNLTKGKNLGEVSYLPNSKEDGFLEVNWSQGNPYNLLCPLDLANGGRSLTGCPATAMAMILDYHKETHGTSFDDNDDYYHNFYDQYTIDDDHETYDFPAFPELNDYIDSLQYCYDNELTPNDTLIAALNFACGVAATQVYSASVSGTYGVNQAFSAYQKFNFEQSELLMGGDTSINTRLIENMMYELPAHLALVNPEVTAGHNVVVDGYNSDDYFHFNFGWGGGSNGWYSMPPTNIPYNLTVVEGVVLNINFDSTATPPLPIVANFDASATEILEGESINFMDLSENNPNEWQWAFEGGYPNTAITQNPVNITYNEAGVYAVSLLARNAFSEDSITKAAFITVNPNRVDKAGENNTVKIFPTRTDGKINILIKDFSEIATLVVYDLAGREVLHRALKNRFETIDASSLTNGTYIMKIENKKNLYIEKIIIE